MKSWLWVVAVACVAFAGCSKSAGSRLLGGDEDSNTNSPSTVEEVVTKGIAEEIASKMDQSLAQMAPSAVGCSTGTRTAQHAWVDIPPYVYGGTNTYTVNGVTYTVGYQAKSNGGRLMLSTSYNGTCLASRHYTSGELKYETELQSINSMGEIYFSRQESTYTYWGDGIAYKVFYQWVQGKEGDYKSDYRSYNGFIRYPTW